MSEYVHSTLDDNFDKDVLKANKPVLVDFWAEWCQPCKMISPIVEEIAKEYSGRVKVFKMNVDDNIEIPAKYGIRGIPSLLIFREGDVIATKVGALSKSQLAAFLDENLHSS
ncbi:thioredoxin [Coxiella-like endosymbiont of Rhipicephalus sanguineus]|uniref:thioredoxin TrxA n=1 Tax=Coxiella-like endosymbiont of Rhipicephalus sanguineus TaxID=1955402 RepID=UPI00203E1C62|nr:thioredoxin TrxA [Coxiella-like endosymbiont of Rhipicephalus sanguineus]MBT8506685.1 thioredoxin [Coxiella-like endosymbiont of Rhipicephalus sanguineus]